MSLLHPQGSSTDARVSIELLGLDGEASTGAVRLAIPESHHQCFARNALDMFLVRGRFSDECGAGFQLSGEK